MSELKHCVPFSVIAAIDAERGIGKAGQLPWNLPGDLKHFKTLTSTTAAPGKHNAVIMGRKTWDSISDKYRPLPNRLNVIITRAQKSESAENVLFTSSLEDAVNRLTAPPLKELVAHCFVIGGEQIFKLALGSPFCRKLYLTHIKQTFRCDTFFPPFEAEFEQSNVSTCREENGMAYFFSEYTRK